MKEKITENLMHIKNPYTQKSFTDENRWKEIEVKENKVKITYARDGLTPADKKIIEKMIIESLSGIVDENDLSLLTVSSDSSDVLKAAEQTSGAPSAASPAQIKTGHASPMAKKQVEGVQKVLAIGSGKGGVGKSTFTINLASTLVKMGKKVGVIDADIYGPSVPMLLGKRFDKPMANSQKKIIPLESHGIHFLSFGLFVDEKDPVIWRGPMLGGVLNQFLFDADWSGLDYLLIDLPPGTGDIQLSMVQNCHVDGVIIISTPQDVALLDATKGLEMFRKLQLPILGMVENMSSFVCSNCNHEHFLFGEHGVENAVKKLEVPFLGSIPLELELRQSADQGIPYMSQAAWSERPVAKAFTQVAEKINNYFNPSTIKETKGLFSRLFST